MTEKIYISETQKNFKAHTSLSDNPILFETSSVKGGIFYLGHSCEI